MGWNVAVKFRPSARHGTGVFAARNIKAGTRVWEFDSSMLTLERRTMETLEPGILSQALLGGYLHEPTQIFIWYSDGMQFINHGPAGEANVGLDYWPAVEEDHIVALRDISAGEELLEDYGMCLRAGLAPGHWMQSLYLRFCPDHYAFLLATAAADQEAYSIELEPVSEGRNLRSRSDRAGSRTGFDRTASNPEVKQAA